MKLGSLVNKDFILVGHKFNSVIEAVDSFIMLFNKKKLFTAPVSKVQEKARDREALGGTVLPPGIALPHARIEGIDDLIVGIWVPPEPIKTDDGEVKLLFFFLTSTAGSPLYLPVLSAVAKSCRDPLFFSKLCSSSRDEFHNLLDGIDITKDVTVENIMTQDPLTCTPETTLSELSDIFYKKGLSYLPVVNKKGAQIGEVTIKDILSRGVPDYIRRMGSIRFLKNLEPFEALLRNEDTILVKEIMRKPTRKIQVDASIIEAVVMITSKGYRHLPVFDKGKLVGVLSETDILKKVLRG